MRRALTTSTLQPPRHAALSTVATQGAWSSSSARCTTVRASMDRITCWPDPDPTAITKSGSVGEGKNDDEKKLRMATQPVVDDVSGFNQTPVRAVVYPRHEEDLVRIISRCADRKWKVSMRGTQHSMGGQSIAPQGVVIDLKKMAVIENVDPENMTVTCQPGATWADLIAALNPFGLSPRTMQSYSSFSVGGTIAVNGHGITTDFTVSESVLYFDLVLPTGKIVRGCSAGAPEGTEQRRLFGLVCGGYGMFGVISRVVLRVNRNHTLWTETFTTTPEDFGHLYKGIIASTSGNDVIESAASLPTTSSSTFAGNDIDVKLARMDITNLDNITVYLFRRRSTLPTVGCIDPDMKEMSAINRLLYKWLIPPLQELRSAIEAQSGTALDWGDAVDKNSLMYETAEPLARLSEPMFLVDDTFILQEYFVPCECVASFITAIKPIYAELVKGGQQGSNLNQDSSSHKKKNDREFVGEDPETTARVHLLNTTIRHVKADKESVLSYSPDDTFAFVLYFRVRRNQPSADLLQEYQQRFIEIAKSFNGTFYLPYLPHYTSEQITHCYPRVQEFFDAKEEIDPDCLFDSHWLRNYAGEFVSDVYLKEKVQVRTVADDECRCCVEEVFNPLPLLQPAIAEKESSNGPLPIPTVSNHRTDSYRNLLANQDLRAQFKRQFLRHIFNVKDSEQVFSLMNRVAWDLRNKDDKDIYLALCNAFDKEKGPLSGLTEGFKALRQIALQKAELGQETKRIVSRLGRLGTITDYVSIGDNGKMVKTLQEVLEMPPASKTWIVHDATPPAHDVGAAVERGGTDPVGELVRIDYSNCIISPASIPDNSCDLVTMNQGLHHIPQEKLPTFLSEVRRILRPSGLFIVREHDSSPELIPMLDLAHSVFNAVTGVSLTEECNEIRAFRSIEEWRSILCNAGFHDTMQYEMQKGDCTKDEMICFCKGPSLYVEGKFLPRMGGTEDNHFLPVSDSSSSLDARAKRTNKKQSAIPFQRAVEQLPKDILHAARAALESAEDVLKPLEELLVHAAPQGQREAMRGFIKSLLNPLLQSIRKVHAQTDQVQPRSLTIEAIPEEIFHAYAALNLKVESGHGSAQEVLGLSVVKYITSQLFGVGSQQPPAPEEDQHHENDNDRSSGSTNVSSALSTMDIKKSLQRLAASCPEVLDSNNWETKFGFPATMADVLRNSWPLPPGMVISPDTHESLEFDTVLFAAAEKIKKKVDSETWVEMSKVIDAVVEQQPEFHFDILMGRTSTSSSSPWFKLVLVFLGSPKVYFTNAALFASSWYGAPELRQLWDTAKDMRTARIAKKFKETAVNPAVQAELSKSIANIDANIQHVTMKGTNIHTLHKVQEVLAATYQGKDVTDIVRTDLFNKKAGMVRMKLEELDAVFNYGLTPLSMYFYGERVVTVTYRTTDTVPSTTLVHSAASIVRLLDQSHLLPVNISTNLSSKNGGGHSTNKPSHTTTDGELAHKKGEVYNFFKLAEWLQVEIISNFGASLDVEPWYRYPFMPVLAAYFNALRQLSSEVWSRHGFKHAFLSPGFGVSFIPGVVMAMLFGQLKLASMPLLAGGGTSYDQSKLRHSVLVHIATSAADHCISVSDESSDADQEGADVRQPAEPEWPNIFTHCNVGVQRLHPEIYCLDVPVFKPFTQVIKQVAMMGQSTKDGVAPTSSAPPNVTFLNIAGHSQIHLKLASVQHKVAHDHDDQDGSQGPFSHLAKSATPITTVLANFDGVASTVSTISLPDGSDNTVLKRQILTNMAHWNPSLQESIETADPKDLPPIVYTSVMVEVATLAAFVKHCAKHHVEIVQMFDFYFR